MEYVIAIIFGVPIAYALYVIISGAPHPRKNGT